MHPNRLVHLNSSSDCAALAAGESSAQAKAARPDVRILVDSMSGFGAYPVDLAWGIDYLVSSSNKSPRHAWAPAMA